MLVKLCSVVFVTALVVNGVYGYNESIGSVGAKIALNLYEECRKSETGFSPCLKRKAITFVDRLSRMETFHVADGVTILKNGNVSDAFVSSENHVENDTVSRGLTNQDDELSHLLIDKIATFVSSRQVELEIPFPKWTTDDISRSLEEGRKKKKKKIKILKKMMGKMGKMMMMMMAGMGMKSMLLLPIGVKLLCILAKKALFKAKIALLIALVLGLQKLLSGGGGKGGGGGGGGGDSHSHGGGGWSSGGGGGGSGWASGGGGGGGGWSSGGGGGGGWQGGGGGSDFGGYQRSFDNAHDLVYNAYITPAQ